MKRSAILSAQSEEEALESLHANSCTDGLPAVIPTPERVDRMLQSMPGLSPETSLGVAGPLDGEVTVEKVAINAVMAGCLPKHFPVVIAAVNAILDPVFDLTEVQSTTHNLAPLIIVNGPARDECGPIASGVGALGPGHRANASIGRALRLVMINLGGGFPGITDMAVLGHPGKFTYCLAEAEEVSPFAPLHVHMGYAAEQSTVTVVGVEAPNSVSGPPVDPDDPTGPERIGAFIAASLARIGANNILIARGMPVIVLNPGHAAVFAANGYDRARFQQLIYDLASQRRGELRRLASDVVPDGDPDELMRVTACPEDIVVVVAGATGFYSAVMPNWGAGPHGNRTITKEIDTYASCDLPLGPAS